MIGRTGKAALVWLALACFPCALRPLPAARGEGAPPAPAAITIGGVGTIQRIQGDDVVIDDRLYRLVTLTRYATADNTASSREGFRTGDLVLFHFSSGREILLLRRME